MTLRGGWQPVDANVAIHSNAVRPAIQFSPGWQQHCRALFCLQGTANRLICPAARTTSLESPCSNSESVLHPRLLKALAQKLLAHGTPNQKIMPVIRMGVLCHGSRLRRALSRQMDAKRD